jgi:hypothetical protein
MDALLAGLMAGPPRQPTKQTFIINGLEDICGGGGWIRTSVGLPRRIYSPLHLTALPPLHGAEMAHYALVARGSTRQSAPFDRWATEEGQRCGTGCAEEGSHGGGGCQTDHGDQQASLPLPVGRPRTVGGAEVRSTAIQNTGVFHDMVLSAAREHHPVRPDGSPPRARSDLEIVVGDVVIRAGADADEGQMTRGIRGARAAIR